MRLATSIVRTVRNEEWCVAVTRPILAPGFFDVTLRKVLSVMFHLNLFATALDAMSLP
jgi:hypothetical protein